MIYSVYFSPTGNGKKIQDRIRNKLVETFNLDSKIIDITYNRNETYSFDEDDIVIFSSPTYAGRLPNLIMPYYRDNFKGNGAKIFIITTFGNRNMDSSLNELYAIALQNNFKVIGAMSMVVTHGFSSIISSIRPDNQDLSELDEYLNIVVDNIKNNVEVVVEGEVKDYYKPLMEDGSVGNFLKAKSQVDIDKCIKCGICVKVCPVHSIDDGSFICERVCIKCQSCIIKCPVNARYFDNPDYLSHVRMLEKNLKDKRSNNIFINNK